MTNVKFKIRGFEGKFLAGANKKDADGYESRFHFGFTVASR